MVSRYLTKEQKVESRARATSLKLCRWCGLDVHQYSKRRRTFCSDECVHEFRIRSSSSYMRIFIAKRDKYTCQICGLDCRGFIRKLKRFVGYVFGDVKRNKEEEFFQQYGMEWVNTKNRSTFYDVDHLIPVIKGGAQCGEDNLRLLCLSCHRIETAKLRKELAK